MNYQKHYDALINRAKNRLLEDYCETHHIIPRCMGGTDDPTNLVDLTAEEHYVAHQLLIKIYPNNSKLVFAATAMVMSSDTTIRNNKLYGWIKRKNYSIKWENGEYLQYFSALQKDLANKRWADESFRTKMKIINKESSNREEVKKLKSTNMKNRWKDPKYRESTTLMLRNIAANNANNTVWLAKRKKIASNYWKNADQETIDKRKKLGKEIFDKHRMNMTEEDKQQIKKHLSMLREKNLKNPEFRKKISENTKKQWQNPEFRAKYNSKIKARREFKLKQQTTIEDFFE